MHGNKLYPSNMKKKVDFTQIRSQHRHKKSEMEGTLQTWKASDCLDAKDYNFTTQQPQISKLACHLLVVNSEVCASFCGTLLSLNLICYLFHGVVVMAIFHVVEAWRSGQKTKKRRKEITLCVKNASDLVSSYLMKV